MIVKVSRIPAILLVVIFGVFVGVAQEKLRQIEQPSKYIYTNTPIAVTMTMDGNEMPDRKVLAGPDWLKKIRLEVSNISGKDINELRIDLILKEPIPGIKAAEATPETAGIVITLELSFSEPKITTLPAGAKVIIKPPDVMVDRWTQYAQQQGIKDIDRVILDIRSVRFPDDTGWDLGRPTQKDPTSGRYLFVPQKTEPFLMSSVTNILIPETPSFFFT